MEDILFYQNYSPVADVSTMAIGILLYMMLRSTYTMKQKNLTLFKWANFLVVLAAVTSVIYHWLVDRLTEQNKVFVYLFREVTYISLILIFMMFCIYVRNLVGVEGKGKRVLDISMWVVFVSFVLCEISGPFIRAGFYIDENLQVHQNYFRDFFRYAYLYYAIVVACLLFANRRKFVAKMFNCLVGVMVLSFFLIALQTFFLQTSYTCISFTLPILVVMFLFHYNAYDVETGTLDIKAFRGYVQDLGQKEFTMLCLYLQNMTMDKMRGISEELYHANEKYFSDTCTFRLNDENLALIFEDARNKYAELQLERLLTDFNQMYQRHNIEYKLAILHSDPELTRGEDYILLDEYLKGKMSLNSVYRCTEKNVQDFLRQQYILSELRDIHQRKDLDDERVKVYCQPVLNTVTNTFTSAEALMRLVLPNIGMVFPDQFIPLAEKYDYIHTMSLIILNKTCKQIKALEEKGCRLVRVSVNFSITELSNVDFCEEVTEIIRKNGVEYSKIAIELTESQNEKDYKNVKNIMSRLHYVGVKFYLDDFGTGYSNFERIIGLPIDIIKFDRSLTIMASRDEESRFMVESFSEIFKKSNYKILFEGVEDEKDENRCKEMNALYLQGYKYSKPIPMEQLENFLEKAG